MSQIISSLNSANTLTSNSTGYYPCLTHGWQPCTCSSLYQSQCSSCRQYYNGSFHSCGKPPSNSTYTWTTTTNIYPTLKTFTKIREITTDEELAYDFNGTALDIKLPISFSDCFLKVGYVWSPLYPLIFSAYENDSKELSFHLVVGITDKTFIEGDLVILKDITTAKIEDNLVLVQLTERARAYLKKDK